MSVFQKQASRSFSFKGAIANQTGIRGEVLSIGDPVQTTVYKSNPPVPEFWDKAGQRPKMQVKLELQTDMRDPEDPDDDGKRNLWIVVDQKPGGKLAAIQDAAIAAGAKDLAVGGYLELWFTGLDPDSENPDNPRKLFQATWRPPASGGGAFQQQQQQPAPQQAQQQQQQQQQFQPSQQEGFNTGGAVYQPGPQQVVNQGPPQQVQQPGPSIDPGHGDPWTAAGGPPQQQQQGFNPGTGELFGAGPGTPAPQQQAAQSWPAPQPAAAAAPPTAAAAPPTGAAAPPLNPEQIKTMILGGATDADIQSATGAPFETIQAVRNFARLSNG